MFRYKKININNIKQIEFREDSYEPEDDSTILTCHDLVSIYYDRKDKIYIVENEDGLIFNPREIKVTHKD
jgi:hypothetical protein